MRYTQLGSGIILELVCVSARAFYCVWVWEKETKRQSHGFRRVGEKTFCCENVQPGCSFSLSRRINDLHYF